MVRASTFLWIRCLLLGTVWILAKGANSQEADLPTGEAAKVDIDYFERHIRPVFVTECYGCHSSQAKSIQGGLRLDLRAGWQRGGDSGPALDTAHPERSLLLRAVQHAEDVAAMPPEKNLPVETVEHLRVWIAAGAPGPDDITSSNAPPASSPQTHWAFQLPTTPPLDRIPSTWARNRLDRLVEMGHRVKQLSPAAEVDRAAYARRIYQDLLGLPAPYEQIQSFLRAETPNAHEQLIDQLLASPRFGERWARLWLDVSRYADTKGYVFTQSRDYPDAHRYRDWVIRSFNLDRRYDEFIRYQLAADQLAPEDANELAAMGYLTLGRRFLNNRHDIIDDRIDVVSRGIIGLTVTCARCHSHKFDPIPIEDYYSLYGVFDSSDEPGNEPSSLRLVDKQEPVTPVVFVRGNPGRRGAEVPRQFLSVLSGADRKPFTQGSGRLELANAIASEQNPLTARVLVNRVWGRLMGQYLVDTPSDFGIRSQSPDLQPVLDDLAVSFMKHDWSIKWLVREIVSSSTYRQMASADAATIAADPENRYCTRMNRRRLDFEALRDSILSVTLELRAESIGGPSIDITKPDSVLRRSVYAFIDRQNLPGLFRTFDLASPDTHAPKRYQTTVPQQALYLMNSPFIWKAAASLGDAVRTREEPVEEKIVWLYRQVLSRDPADWERQRSLEFVRQTEDVETSKARWNELAQILLVCNEFVFID